MAWWSQEAIFSADDAGIVGSVAPDVDGLNHTELEGEQSMDLESGDDMRISSGDDQEVAPQGLGRCGGRSTERGLSDDWSPQQRVMIKPRVRVQAPYAMSPRYQKALQFGAFWRYDQSVHGGRDHALYGRVQHALSAVLSVYGEILHFYPSEQTNAGVLVLFAHQAAAERALLQADQVAKEFAALCEVGHGQLLAMREGFLPKVMFFEALFPDSAGMQLCSLTEAADSINASALARFDELCAGHEPLFWSELRARAVSAGLLASPSRPRLPDRNASDYTLRVQTGRSAFLGDHLEYIADGCVSVGVYPRTQGRQRPWVRGSGSIGRNGDVLG